MRVRKRGGWTRASPRSPEAWLDSTGNPSPLFLAIRLERGEVMGLVPQEMCSP